MPARTYTMDDIGNPRDTMHLIVVLVKLTQAMPGQASLPSNMLLSSMLLAHPDI